MHNGMLPGRHADAAAANINPTLGETLMTGDRDAPDLILHRGLFTKKHQDSCGCRRLLPSLGLGADAGQHCRLCDGTNLHQPDPRCPPASCRQRLRHRCVPRLSRSQQRQGGRLQDFRRIATRSGKLASKFLLKRYVSSQRWPIGFEEIESEPLVEIFPEGY